MTKNCLIFWLLIQSVPIVAQATRIELTPINAEAIPTVDDLNVRAGPGLSHPILFQIGNLRPVHATGRLTTASDIDGRRGHWTEIRDGSDTGWVFGYYLAYSHQFDPVTHWAIEEMRLAYGDVQICLSFSREGEFAGYKEYVSSAGIRRRRLNGRVWEYKGIYWFKAATTPAFASSLLLRRISPGDWRLIFDAALVCDEDTNADFYCKRFPMMRRQECTMKVNAAGEEQQ